MNCEIQQGQHTLIIGGVDAELGSNGNNHTRLTSQLSTDIDYISLLKIEAVVVVGQGHGMTVKPDLHKGFHRGCGAIGGGSSRNFRLSILVGHKADHSLHSKSSHYKYTLSIME